MEVSLSKPQKTPLSFTPVGRSFLEETVLTLPPMTTGSALESGRDPPPLGTLCMSLSPVILFAAMEFSSALTELFEQLKGDIMAKKTKNSGFIEHLAEKRGPVKAAEDSECIR